MTPQTLSSDLKIVGTRPGIQWKMADYRSFLGTSNFLAPNAPAGLTVDYFAKSAGPVRATITDASGAPDTDTQCTRRSGRGQPSHMGYAL